MGRVRVLQLIPRLGRGGGERVALHLVSGLNADRYQVGAVSLYDEDDADPDLSRQFRALKVPVFYLGKRTGLDLRMIFRLSRVINDFQPHIAHSHLSILRYALPALLWHRVPVRVHTVHNLAEKEVDRLGILLHRLVFRRLVQPVSIAQEVTRSLVRLYGGHDYPMIPNGIPLVKYRQPHIGRQAWRAFAGFQQRDVLFVSVGRLDEQKDPVLLVRAFARALGQVNEAHLLFVGAGALGQEVAAQARASGIEDRVHLLGRRSDVADILHASDVFVSSSKWEGNPLAVMEAMVAGKPVVSTAVGGVPELIADGTSGVLVPPGDVEALGRALWGVFRDEEFRTALGAAAAHQGDARFGLATMARRYEELYERELRRAHKQGKLRTMVDALEIGGEEAVHLSTSQ